ncbi:RHS repeat-associated core domain-containing protein [Alteromonas aestuariivivens]|uniref:RHS repeat-associated core domain-containing protein n=1 Tax=Alteromonas aestuariivivens TaxID=1938339 RepID=A0A3D8M6B9_9ALTE|nr:RHS repeat-associated core domain-containing protein [Alteromonas aestuariivivens]RDV25095.1 RHS repeat-associated core domain-containing protein [Alteromonas aestuariivivens]
MYMQARYYDPVIGRFYSNDPIGFRDVHSFNRYAYANNNPYRYTDPTGRIPESFDEWKNLGIGALSVAGSVGEPLTGTVGVAYGAADLLAGSKVLGSLSMAGGLYLIHDSKYTFENGANKIKDAWNNETGKNNRNTPEGPLEATASTLGCSSDCQKVAGTIDKGIEMVAGKNASSATNGMKVIEGLNTAGDVASKAEQIEKITNKLEEQR